jgi:hypothetical protein
MYDPATMLALDPAGTSDGLLLGPVEVVRGLDSAPPSPQVLHAANFGNKVRLIGYDLDGQDQPGGGLQLTLFWEGLAPVAEDYTVFVHLAGDDGTIWGQQDSQPVTGFYPTSLWTPGEYVRNQVKLPILEETPTGEYDLKVGLYRSATGERLPILDSKGKVLGDSTTLGPVQVADSQSIQSP